MKILVLNCRIYSIEYELFDMPSEKELCKGVLEHIGFEQSILTHSVNNKTERFVQPICDYKKGLDFILSTIISPEYGCIKFKDEIKAIGHRIVHGGSTFTSSVLIDENVKKEINRDFEIAPLHNPYNLQGIEEIEKILPNRKNVGVFDTSFHQTLPEVAYRYALPERLFHDYKIRRYGFHGIFHKYTAETVSEIMKDKKINIISFHLGAGSSVCAIRNGKSIDTSMGFTPLEGLVMTDRPGDMDVGIVLYLLRRGWTLTELEPCLNRESGTYGISAISSNMEGVVKEAEKGDKKSQLAIEIFVYRARKYLGAYWFALDGKVDAIGFTGGIGENSPLIREKILHGFDKFGIKIDYKKNIHSINTEREINVKGSKVKIFTLPRNAKILIARETYDLLKKS